MMPMLRTESDGDIMSDPNDSAGNVGWGCRLELIASSSVFPVLSLSWLIDNIKILTI